MIKKVIQTLLHPVGALIVYAAKGVMILMVKSMEMTIAKRNRAALARPNPVTVPRMTAAEWEKIEAYLKDQNITFSGAHEKTGRSMLDVFRLIERVNALIQQINAMPGRKVPLVDFPVVFNLENEADVLLFQMLMPEALIRI